VNSHPLKHANNIMSAGNLDDLADAVRVAFSDGCERSELASAGVDWDDLPTFGGDEPDDFFGIFSWDADGYLILDGSDPESCRVEPRAVWDDC